MSGKIAVLQRAIDEVSEEQSVLRDERDALDEFRETISHTYPSTDGDAQRRLTVGLLERYRETVMPRLDADLGHDGAVENSLEAELSPGIADAFLSRAPFTNRLKRKLLVQTSTAIDRRSFFHDDLETEKRSLETAATELPEIRASVAVLPDCTLRETNLEGLLDTWEAYDDLEAACERLIAQRQQQLDDPSRYVTVRGEEHALCRYLYADLETTYPVLSAVASVCEQIQEARNPSRPPITPA